MNSCYFLNLTGFFGSYNQNQVAGDSNNTAIAATKVHKVLLTL